MIPDPSNPYSEAPYKSLLEIYQVDPFAPPGGFLHVRGSVVWSCLPEVIYLSLSDPLAGPLGLIWS